MLKNQVFNDSSNSYKLYIQNILGYFTRVIMIDHKINYNKLRDDVAENKNFNVYNPSAPSLL